MSKEQCQGAQILTSSYTLKNTKTITLRYLFFCDQSIVIFWYHTSFFFFFSNKYSCTYWPLPYLLGTVPQGYQQQSREMLTLQLLLFVVLVAQSSPTLCDPMDCSLPGSSVHGYSPGKNTGVGCHALLQGIFPTQGWNPCVLHCRQILYRLSHQGRSVLPLLSILSVPGSLPATQELN